MGECVYKFDLEERTSKFGEEVLRFCKTLSESTISRPLIHQLVKSSTSIGANYMEADCAESKKDFRHKISICKKESKETMYWFRMIIEIAPSDKIEECKKFKQEAKELTLIFSKIIHSCDKGKD